MPAHRWLVETIAMHRELEQASGQLTVCAAMAEPNIAESLPFKCLRFGTGSIVQQPSLC